MGHLFVALTVLLTVYGQIVVKWRILEAGALPESSMQRVTFLLSLSLTPWVLSAFVAAYLAALCWMAAMTRLPLSHAYPFVSLTFVLVVASGVLIFQESITPLKLIGAILIVSGVIIGGLE